MSFCKPGVTCDDTGLREEWETELVSKFIPASVHAAYDLCVPLFGLLNKREGKQFPLEGIV